MIKRQKPHNQSELFRDARTLYEAHRTAAARTTKILNLEKLWQILNEIWEDGVRDYSIAEIGRRLEYIGGPKTQSLRNAQGAHFREIIQAFAKAAEGSTRYVAKNKSNVERALDLISDPSIRGTIRFAIDDAKRLKVVNDNLHAAFKTLQLGQSLQNAASSTQEGPDTPAQSKASTNVLSPRHRIALDKGIKESRLAQQGLHIAEDGSIQNDRGDKIFPPAFAFAIRAILNTEE